MEEFSCGTRILCGGGALEALGTLGATRVLVMTDETFTAGDVARRAAEAARCVETSFFPRAAPTVEQAAEGMAIARAFRPDLIVALGDGGVIDCAKAVAFFSRAGCTLAAVPTASGSGAEVSDRAALTFGGARRLLRDARLRPDAAILDSDLLPALPKPRVAEAGMEILSHSLEAYVARGAGALTDICAREALRSGFAALPAAYAGSTQARLKVHLAGVLAGAAWGQAGLGLSHALACALGELFDLPQGRLNAVLLPAVIRCNAHAAGEKYAELARTAGFSGSASRVALGNLLGGLLRLRRELELPETLTQAGIDPRAVWRNAERITAIALAEPSCRDNPLEPEDFLIRRVLEEVTGRI